MSRSNGGGGGPSRTAQTPSRGRSGNVRREKSPTAVGGDQQEERDDVENGGEGDEAEGDDDADDNDPDGLYAMSHQELTDLAIRHMGWTKSMCVRELPYSLARALESVGIDRDGRDESETAPPSTSRVPQRVASRSASAADRDGDGGGGDDRKRDTVETRARTVADAGSSDALRSGDKRLAPPPDDAKSEVMTTTTTAAAGRHYKTRMDERGTGGDSRGADRRPPSGEKKRGFSTSDTRTRSDVEKIARKRANQESDSSEAHANGRNEAPRSALRVTLAADASKAERGERGPNGRVDGVREKEARAATTSRRRDTKRPTSVPVVAVPAAAVVVSATDRLADGDRESVDRVSSSVGVARHGERKDQALSPSPPPPPPPPPPPAGGRIAKTSGFESSSRDPLAAAATTTHHDSSDTRRDEFAATFVAGADALSRATHHRTEHRREASLWLLQLRYVWLTMNDAALHERHLTAVLALVDDWRRTHRDCVPQWHEAARTAAERLYVQTHELALLPWLVVETRRLEPLVHLLAHARLSRVLSHDDESEALERLCRRAQRTIDAYDRDAEKQPTSSPSPAASAPPLSADRAPLTADRAPP